MSVIVMKCNIHEIGDAKRKKIKNRAEAVFQQLMAEIFLKLMEDTK